MLGNTLGEIAREKAGIIKTGSPVISNVDDPEAARVIREAAYERGCDFYDASQTKPMDVKKSLDGYSFKGFSFGGAPFPVELKMIGMHQVSNLSLIHI